MTHVIAINNQKGGVGKTTTTVSLAACLGARGYSTLVVDMDPQGNATSALGVDTRTLKTSLYRTLVGLDTPDPISLGEQVPNVWLLPSNMNLAAAELDFLSLENRERRLETVLASLDLKFDFVLVDSPPSLNMLSLNSLVAANWVMVPVQAEFLALEGLTHVMNTIQRVQQSYNPGLQLLGIVVTLYDSRTRLALEVVQQLESHFNGKVFQSKIVRSVRLSEAPSYGKPILYYDPKSSGAIAYMQLSEEVAHVCQEAGIGARIGSAVQHVSG